MKFRFDLPRRAQWAVFLLLVTSLLAAPLHRALHDRLHGSASESGQNSALAKIEADSEIGSHGVAEHHHSHAAHVLPGAAAERDSQIEQRGAAWISEACHGCTEEAQASRSHDCPLCLIGKQALAQGDRATLCASNLRRDALWVSIRKPDSRARLRARPRAPPTIV